MDPYTLRKADMADARRVSFVLTAAFQADPVSTWLIPEPIERANRHPDFFRIAVDNAILWGDAYINEDFSGVALWHHVDPDKPKRPSDDYWLYEKALEGNYRRFEVLAQEMKTHHPMHIAHAYLEFVGVKPDNQGHGLGWNMLRHKLSELDLLGTPTYLEASSGRSALLYRRLGFSRIGSVIQLPNGPELIPMWREAMPAA